MSVQHLNAEQKFFLSKKRLESQVFIFSALLASVFLLNMAPLLLSIVRRPSDDVVNNIKESNLLLTGAVTSAASFFLGYSTGKKEEESTYDSTRTNNRNRNLESNPESDLVPDSPDPNTEEVV